MGAAAVQHCRNHHGPRCVKTHAHTQGVNIKTCHMHSGCISDHFAKHVIPNYVTLMRIRKTTPPKYIEFKAFSVAKGKPV